ncbi:MAG TPA: TonB-dependent receptor, partial [Chitinophagaceae bacterium]|nr:TonB-dependent receptor [Chitinophagaceae bacterium]
TVTATIQPITVDQTGRNLVVLNGAQFEKLPVHSIDELLRYVPGLEVQARGPMGMQSDFVLRGSTFQQVLVVLDGLRLNDPITGHFSSYIPIAPAEIERIEILKGASSAIYGSDAVGGVIHIITKTFASKNNIPAQQNLNASLITGEWGLLNAQVGGYYKNKKTAIAGGFLSNNASGQPLRGTRGSFHLHTASLSLNHQLTENWKLCLRSALDNRKFAAQNYYTASPADTADEKVETAWNQLQLRYQKNNTAFTLHGGLKNSTDAFQFNPNSVANNNKSTLLQALAVYEHNFFKSSYLTTGVQFQNRRIKSNDRGNHSVKQAAVFAVVQQAIGTALHVTPALRLDYDERSGTELIPQLNVSYKINAFQLRGSAGKTIRQADFTELYNNYNKAFVPSLNRIGNPDLTAETSFSYEAGIDFFAGKLLKIAATYFQRDYDDLIDFASTPYSQMPRQENLSETGTYFLAKNLATVTTRGFETDMVFSKSLAAGRQFNANWGFVFLHSASSSGTPSLYLSSHAKFLTNFTARYSAPRWSASVAGLYKERSPQAAPAIKAVVSKDYFVLHVKAEAFIIKQKVSAVAQVDNILNRNYSDLLGAQMPQRWLMGGFRLSL